MARNAHMTKIETFARKRQESADVRKRYLDADEADRLNPNPTRAERRRIKRADKRRRTEAGREA